MASRELMLTVPDAVVSSLKEATDVIARDSLIRHAEPPEPPTPPPPTKQPAPTVDRRPAPEPETEITAPPPADQPQRPSGPKSVATARPLMQVLAQKRTATAESQPVPPSVTSAGASSHLEELSEQILLQLQHRNRASDGDFSISKLLAGIMQIIALAVLALAFLIYQNHFQSVALVAIFLQLFTIALLIMGRQK
jgi:hypothetical protein